MNNTGLNRRDRNEKQRIPPGLVRIVGNEILDIIEKK